MGNQESKQQGASLGNWWETKETSPSSFTNTGKIDGYIESRFVSFICDVCRQHIQYSEPRYLCKTCSFSWMRGELGERRESSDGEEEDREEDQEEDQEEEEKKEEEDQEEKENQEDEEGRDEGKQGDGEGVEDKGEGEGEDEDKGENEDEDEEKQEKKKIAEVSCTYDVCHRCWREEEHKDHQYLYNKESAPFGLRVYERAAFSLLNRLQVFQGALFLPAPRRSCSLSSSFFSPSPSPELEERKWFWYDELHTMVRALQARLLFGLRLTSYPFEEESEEKEAEKEGEEEKEGEREKEDGDEEEKEKRDQERKQREKERAQGKKKPVVLILSENRVEWIASDFACVLANVISVPLSHSLSPKEVAMIAEKTDPSVVIVSPSRYPLLCQAFSLLLNSPSPSPSPSPSTSFPQQRNKLPIRLIIQFNDQETGHVSIKDGLSEIGVSSEDWRWFLKKEEGGKENIKENETKAELEQPIALMSWEDALDVEPSEYVPPRPCLSKEEILSIIFTSGSTGQPKGTIFTDTLLNQEIGSITPLYLSPMLFCFEPLCYATQRFFTWDTVSQGGQMVIFSGEMEHFLQELQYCSPTNLSAPPRVWNMLYSVYKADYFLEIDQLLLKREEKSERGNEKEELSGLELQKIEIRAKQKATKKARQRLGERIRLISTGGASTCQIVWEWMKETFYDLKVREGYGTTEVGSIASNGKRTLSTLVHLEDIPELGYSKYDKPLARGLLWVRNSHMTPGYYRDSVSTDSNFVLRDDIDGFVWYNTGDIVEYEESGDRLRVIDRYKNITKLANALFVAPEHLENVFVVSKYVENIFIYADPDFESVVAVIQPNRPVLLSLISSLSESPSSSLLTLSSSDLDWVWDDSRIIRHILEDFVSIALNERLSPHQIPSHLLIEPVPWSIENGLLTTSFKLARPVLRRQYREKLRQMCFKEGTTIRQQTDTPEHPKERVFQVLSQKTEKIKGVIEEVLGWPIEQCGDRPLKELGIDSVTIIQLTAVLSSYREGTQPIHASSLFSLSIPSLLELVTEPNLRRVESSSSNEPSFDFKKDLSLPSEISQVLKGVWLEKEGGGEKKEEEEEEMGVFLTGVSGFVGVHILYQVLLSYPKARVYCLVRPAALSSPPSLSSCHPSPEHIERLDRVLLQSKIKLTKEQQDRIHIIPGDLGSPLFSLSPDLFSSLSSRLHVVIHNGCMVSGVQPYALLREPNVLGTVETLRLASQMGKRCFRYLFVSSLSSLPLSSSLSSEGHVSVPLVEEVKKMSGYGMSKRVSELLVYQAFGFGLPAVIIRPGAIGPNSITGVSNPSDFLTRYVLSLFELQTIPETSLRELTYVPVDFVAALCVCFVSCPILWLLDQKQDKLGGSFSQKEKEAPVLNCIGDGSIEVELSDVHEYVKELVPNITEVEYKQWFEQVSKGSPQKVPIASLLEDFRNGFPVLSNHLATQFKTVQFAEKWQQDPDLSQMVFLKQIPFRTFFKDSIKILFDQKNQEQEE